VHQLNALCLSFDQQRNNYCATQLCSCRDGLIVQICRQLSLDRPHRQLLFLQLVRERKSASISGTVGNKSPLGLFQTPVIMALFLIEAAERMLQPRDGA
jgi:hypothetical protein